MQEYEKTFFDTFSPITIDSDWTRALNFEMMWRVFSHCATADGQNVPICHVFGVDNGGSTAVKHSPHHLKVEGSSLSAATSS